MLALTNWIKNNWILVVALGIIGFMFWNQGASSDLYSSLMQKYNEQAEAHAKEIKDLETINHEKDLALQEAHEDYTRRVVLLRAQYEETITDLEAKKGVTRKRILKNAHRDPTTLARAIEDTFKIPYYVGELP